MSLNLAPLNVGANHAIAAHKPVDTSASVGDVHGLQESKSMKEATPAQTGVIGKAMSLLSKSLEALISPARAKVGEMVSKDKGVTEIKELTSTVIKATKDGVAVARDHLANKGWFFEASIMSNIKKGIAEHLDTIMSSKTVQTVTKHILMTNTRVTPDDILLKTNNPEQKKEWAGMMQDMKLTLRDGKESPTLRFSRENLAKIQDRLNTLTNSGATDAKTGSEMALCKALVQTYTVRLELKENYSKIFQEGAAVVADLVSALKLADFDKPETLLRGIVTACKDNPEMRTHLDSLVNNPENALRKVVVAAAGENAIHGIKLATSKEGLAIVSTLLEHVSTDAVSAFMTDPVGTLFNNRALLGNVAGKVCDQFVDLLNNAEMAKTIMSMSNGSVGPEDIKLLKQVVPTLKDIVSESMSPSPSAAGVPSKTAQLLSKVASHVSERCDVELKKVQKPGTESLPVEATFGQLMSHIDSSISFLVNKTMGTPDAIALSTPPEKPAETHSGEKSAEAEKVPEKTQSWGEWAAGWGSTLVSAGSKAGEIGLNLIENNLGSSAAAIVRDVTTSAAGLVTNAANAAKESVTDALASAVNSVVDKGLTIGAQHIAGKIDTAIDGVLNPQAQASPPPSAEPGVQGATVQMTLNKDKLTELVAQSVQMASQFIAKNPGIIDSMGQSAATFLVNASDIMQDPSLNQADRGAKMSTAMKDNLTSLGQAAMSIGDPNSVKAGRTLINVGSVMGSELVQRSFAQSNKLFAADTMGQLSKMAQGAVSDTLTGVATKALAEDTTALNGLDPKVGDGSVSVPKFVGDMLKSDASSLSAGGMVGKLIKFVGPEIVNNTLEMARQIVE